MAEIDLDAARAARDATKGEGPTVRFMGETFQLPPTLSWDFVEYADQQNATAALKELFGDEKEYERFRALKPSLADIVELISAMPAKYGLGAGPGEARASGRSRASGGSSSSVSGLSKPTSKRSTGSTSRKPSGATSR